MAARPQQTPDLPIEVDENEARPSKLLGTLIGGRYRVIREMARGGLGVVYEAKHVELERVVALKVLSDELARKAEVIKRFQREAQTASQIGHPNIVDVHDFGRTNEGFPYLAMEKLEGHDLDHVLEHEGAIPPARVVEILAQVASALDAVHKRGVVHRDIKPANIFLARRIDGSEQVKLLDFGLAAFHEQGDRLTQMGNVVGTPHYMPPEAAEGDLAGPQGDVYSLAVVAYEALCGVLPFDAEQATGVLVKKVARPAPTMSARTGKQYPPALEQVLSRALSRELAKRPQTAGEFVSKLRDAIQTTGFAGATPALPAPETLQSEDDGRPEIMESQPMPELPRRSRAPLFAGLAVVVLLAAGSIAAYVAFVLPRGEESVPQPIAAEELPAPRPSEEPVMPPEPVAEVPGPRAPAVQEPAPPPVVAPQEPAQRPVQPVAQQTARERRPPRPVAPEQSEEAAPVADSAQAIELTRQATSALIRGQLADAARLAQSAVNADAGYAPAYRVLGMSRQNLGQRPEAARAFRRYLALAPGARDAAEVRQRLAALDQE